MKKNQRFWRAEVEFMHSNKGTSKVYGQKRDNCSDCINELEHFLRLYAQNEVISIGIFKRYS